MPPGSTACSTGTRVLFQPALFLGSATPSREPGEKSRKLGEQKKMVISSLKHRYIEESHPEKEAVVQPENKRKAILQEDDEEDTKISKR